MTPRVATTAALVAALALRPAAAQVPAGGQALPDAVTQALHAAITQQLIGEASQIAGPAVDPSGAPIGDTIKMGLVLVKDVTIEQFQQAQQQLNALKNAPPSVQDAELQKLTDLSGEALDAFTQMNELDRGMQGDLHGEFKGSYESDLRDAEFYDNKGQHAEADALRQRAGQRVWGQYLQARQRFYRALGAHPLLGVRLPGGFTNLFMDQPYLFAQLAQAKKDGKSVTGLRTLLTDHIDQAVKNLHDQEVRITNLNTWTDLFELANPAFEGTQKVATGVGGDLGKGLVDAVTGTAKGANAVKAYGSALSSTALSIVQVGSMLIPIAGPLISAGITTIQVYKSGDDYIVALGDVKNATQGATVTGYQTVISASDKASEAGKQLLVNVAMAPAEIPGFVSAVKSGKVLVKRGATALREAGAAIAGGRTATGVAAAEETAAGARGATVTETPTSTAGAAAAKTATGALSDAEFLAGVRSEFGDAVADGVAKAQELGVPRNSIEEMLRGARFDETAAKNSLPQAKFEERRAIAANARRTLERVGEIDQFIKDARAAGVPEDVISATVARAKAKGTVTGWATTLRRELTMAEANARGATVVVAPEAKGADEVLDYTASDYRDWAGGMPPARTVTMSPVDIAGLQAKVRIIVKNPRLAAQMGVRLSNEELRVLFQEVLPRSEATRVWYYLDRDEGGLVKAFDDQFYRDVDRLRELYPDQFTTWSKQFGPPTPVVGPPPPRTATSPVAGSPSSAAKGPTVAVPPLKGARKGTPLEGTVPVVPEASGIFGGPKFDAKGFNFKGVTPTGVASLTDEELSRALKQLYNNPRAARAAVRDALYAEAARRITPVAGAAAGTERGITGTGQGLTPDDEKRAAAAMAGDEPAPTVTPPPSAPAPTTPPDRTPTGTASAPAPKPEGLTPADEKAAAKAMAGDEQTSSLGTLTIDPNGHLAFTPPGASPTYPGLFGPNGGFLIYPPGTTLPGGGTLPPLPPVAITPPTAITTGTYTINPNGTVTYHGIPFSGFPGPDGPGPVIPFPGALVFQPPNTPPKGTTGGGASGGAATGGAGGGTTGVTPGGFFPPPNDLGEQKGMGWGESGDFEPTPPPPYGGTPGGGLIDGFDLGGGLINDHPGGCCFPGVQPLIFDLGAPVTVSPSGAGADADRAPSWPWLLRDVVSAVRALVDGGRAVAATRALSLGNLPIGLPPQQTRADSGAPRETAPAGALRTIIRSLGTSQGDAFDLQILNEGRSPLNVSGSGVVVEPLKREAQQELERQLAKLTAHAGGVTRRVEAYCLAYGLRPPSPGMLFQIATPDIQQKFAPARAVLQAGQKLALAGVLTPDSNPKSYVESIKQYAIWTKLEHWDLKQFTEAWVEKTKANALALKRNWTKEMESALVGAAPGRWKDVQLILDEAQR